MVSAVCLWAILRALMMRTIVWMSLLLKILLIGSVEIHRSWALATLHARRSSGRWREMFLVNDKLDFRKFIFLSLTDLRLQSPFRSWRASRLVNCQLNFSIPRRFLKSGRLGSQRRMFTGQQLKIRICCFFCYGF